MNKPELIKAVAEKVGISQADAERAFDYTIRLITRAIVQEGRHEVGGFGVFKMFRSKAVDRPSIQDRTKIIHTPARFTVKFHPSKLLKAAIN